jgi:pimeloyl-ACP methyl ester carboxylesterase
MKEGRTMNHDVYVLVPGILGSVLQKDDKDAFGLTAGAGFRALFSAGRSITGLELDEPAWVPDPSGVEEVRTIPNLGDGVTADRLAGDAHLIPGLWKVDGYGEVGQFLRKRFGLVAGENYFEFPYDWRRDNRVAAHQLASACGRWLAARRTQHPDAQLVLLGHSMGGLVSRYFLEVLGGWRDTRRLITFGTPYRGSLNAVDFAANGFSKFFGLVDLTDLLVSFTSVHQLLPIYRCISTDGRMQRLTEVPEALPRLTPTQIHAARGFHREIEDAVAQNQQDEEYGNRGEWVRPVIGIDQPTYQSAIRQGARLEMARSYEGDDMGGDGTVPRVSASPQEAKSDQSAMFSSDKHASLQNADGVHTQVRGWVNQIDLGDFLAVAPEHVRVDTADVHKAGVPLRVELNPSAPVGKLVASLAWVGGPNEPSVPVEAVELSPVGGATDVEFAAKEPGVYRLQVEGPESEDVSDLLVVAPA